MRKHREVTVENEHNAIETFRKTFVSDMHYHWFRSFLTVNGYSWRRECESTKRGEECEKCWRRAYFH